MPFIDGGVNQDRIEIVLFQEGFYELVANLTISCGLRLVMPDDRGCKPVQQVRPADNADDLTARNHRHALYMMPLQHRRDLIDRRVFVNSHDIARHHRTCRAPVRLVMVR